MPTNFTLSSGASFTIRDQTIEGDKENTTITGLYNTTTTKVVGSYNMDSKTDTSSYYTNDYGESYSSRGLSGGSNCSGKSYTGGYYYKNYNTYSQPQQDNNEHTHHEPDQHDVNSNYGLPLGPGSPRTPPPAPKKAKQQFPSTPSTPTQFGSQSLQTQGHEQLQPFVLPIKSPSWNSLPNTTEPQEPAGSRRPNPFNSCTRIPTQSSYGEVIYSTPFTSSRSPHAVPIGVNSISSPKAEPVKDSEEYGDLSISFATPRTEAGMISPLNLARA